MIDGYQVSVVEAEINSPVTLKYKVIATDFEANHWNASDLNGIKSSYQLGLSSRSQHTPNTEVKIEMMACYSVTAPIVQLYNMLSAHFVS